MAIEDVALKAVRKVEEKETTTTGDKIKSKAGLVINIFAALLAANSYISNGLNSTIMNNTIKANDIWNFYQAKSMKQTMYELAAFDTTDPVLIKKYTEKATSYESEPINREGKKELSEDAKKLESARDLAKKKIPWISYASSAFQISIVLISTSILSANIYLFFGSFVVALSGLVLMLQGIFLWW